MASTVNDLDWLAGFLDGRGTLWGRWRHGFKPQVQVSGLSATNAQWLAARFGGQANFLARRGDWQWRVTRQDTLLWLLPALIPRMRFRGDLAQILANCIRPTEDGHRPDADHVRRLLEVLRGSRSASLTYTEKPHPPVA